MYISLDFKLRGKIVGHRFRWSPFTYLHS